MFDVFYLGQKPNLFRHEKHAQSISEAKKQSKTRYFWIINSFSDYSDFDFLWEPAPWESHYVHAWPSQWQKDGQTYLVPKQEHDGIKYQSRVVPRIYREHNWEIPKEIDVENFDFTWHPDANDPPYIYQFGTQHQKTGGPRYVMEGATETKYVRNIVANKTSSTSSVIYFIDHHDGNLEHAIETVNDKTIEIQTTRYASDYLSILRRIAKKADGQHEHVWVCSSLCDYSEFDFSWYPEQWQNHMVHVFPSNEQKFGDTFFIHVPSLLDQLDVELLEWHDINFIDNVSVPRWKCPVIEHDYDSHIQYVQKNTLSNPLSLIKNTKTQIKSEVPTVSLWRQKTKNIVSLNKSSSACIIPREASLSIETQIYDYPYIKKKSDIATDELQDIIFVSYDEPQAEKNWNFLKHNHLRAKRVHGVRGMENALKAAAQKSETPWYYAVFAKTELNPEFNFDFFPDYFQKPKNYIFDCKNEVNGLIYGHMGVVLYNCNLIKNAANYENLDLDYTLSFPHESVPILSCFGKFNSTPYQTWRTAFRETSKLCYFQDLNKSIENEYRIHTWTNYADGEYAEWCIRGANDGLQFAEEINYDLKKLKNSFRWEWLQSYFESLYGSIDNF